MFLNICQRNNSKINIIHKLFNYYNNSMLPISGDYFNFENPDRKLPLLRCYSSSATLTTLFQTGYSVGYEKAGLMKSIFGS